MEIIEKASAGTVDKCDCLITVSKGEGYVKINLTSKVYMNMVIVSKIQFFKH